MVNLLLTRVSRQVNRGKIIFSTNDSGTTGYTRVRDDVGPLYDIIYTINSIRTTNLNIRAKTRKLVEENIGRNVHEQISIGNGFLNTTPKAKMMGKKVIDKLASSKLKTMSHWLMQKNPQRDTTLHPLVWLEQKKKDDNEC